MALSHSPRVVTNGLVLYFDAANASKNATGSLASNLIVNGNFANGQGSPQEVGSNPTNTIVALANPGDTGWVLQQTGNYAEYQLNISSGMSASTTYVMSGWYAKSANYVGADVMFHSRAYAAGGSHVATGFGIGSLIYSTVVNGITWEFRYQAFTTPSDFTGYFEWYVGYGTNNTGGVRYYTNLRLEKGTYPSIRDLSGNGNTGEFVNGTTFSSANAGSLSFDGTNDYLTIPHNASLNFGTGDFTVLVGMNGVSAYPGGSKTVIRKGSRFDGNIAGWGIMWAGSPEDLYFIISSSSARLEGRTVPSFGLNGWTGFKQLGMRRSSGTWSQINNTTLTTLGTFTGDVSGTEPLTIAYNSYYGSYMSFGLCYCMVYNRALSSAELSQNFNAVRSRYGV